VKTRIAVIGAGPGGYVAAVRAAQLGAQVTLIDKQPVGGTCLHWGCIPSKIMKTTAETLHQLHQADDLGIELNGSIALNIEKLMARKTRIIQTQVRGIEALLKHHQVELVQGRAAITAQGLVSVTAADVSVREFPWDRLILATGTEPAPLAGIPFDGRQVISSNEVLNLSTLPSSMLIVGGGVIGCEFACILSAMGCDVTLVEALDRLLPLPSVDAACSKVLLREMKKRKIRILLNATVNAVARNADHLSVTVKPFKGEGRSDELTAEKMLVCIGRRPLSADLGLERIGLACDARGWIAADDHLRTCVPDVFAIGDILGPAKIQLAHVASVEGRVAAENAMGMDRSMRYDAVPSAIFTMPEVANVGLSEDQARENGLDVRSETVLFRVIGKAQVMGEIAGEVKIVYDAPTGRILGLHLIGPHVTDLVAEATLALTTGCTVAEMADTIHAHPTLAEAIGEVALKAAGRALHG
jgi:dihydrolipoamide dehydrogenase